MQPISQPISPLAASRPFLQTLPGQAILAVAASLLVAATAHLSVPLPWTPVPLTLSDFAVVVVGLSLAPATAFAALALYLLEGALGAPVFSPTGPGGIAQLFGITGGFLLSYPLAAALTSYLSRSLRIPSRYAVNALAAAAGSALLMVCGVLWFGSLLHLAPAAAFTKAALPFLPGQIIKVLAAAGVVSSARAALHRA